MSDRNRKPTYIRRIKNNAGKICVNYGATEDIQYHHIVPLSLGEQERETNIVALCYRCHKSAHHGRHITKYRSGSQGGRPTKAKDNAAFKVFDLLASGEIGRKKCKELLHLSDSTHISDLAQFKKYMRDNGIKKIKNNIDILGVNGALINGVKAGEIKYRDGTIKEIFYVDSGINDVRYTKKKNL